MCNLAVKLSKPFQRRALGGAIFYGRQLEQLGVVCVVSGVYVVVYLCGRQLEQLKQLCVVCVVYVVVYYYMNENRDNLYNALLSVLYRLSCLFA